MICTSYGVFLHEELPFGDGSDCNCVKIFSGFNFLIAINYLTRLLMQ